jgi:TatD DNase family protein
VLDALCHLHLDPLWADREGVVARARAAGVSRMLVAATDVASWDRVLACREVGPVAVGVHPWFAGDTAELLAVARSEGVDAIGEVGLDALRGDLDEQLVRLRSQLQVAAELDLPVVLHCVRAHHLMLPELRRFGVRGFLHAYSGGPHLVSQYLALGFHFSVGRAVHRPGKRLRAALAAIPDDRLLAESDAPDQVDEPMELPTIVGALRELGSVPQSRLFSGST